MWVTTTKEGLDANFIWNWPIDHLMLLVLYALLFLVQENTSLLRQLPTASSSHRALAAQQKDDIFSNFVKTFLPKPSAFGLSQYNETTRPENFLANKFESAALLPSDTENIAHAFDLSLIRPLLKQTNLEFRELQLLYDADVHGWSAKSFHKQVDRKGPCIVLCQGESSMYYGGILPSIDIIHSLIH